MTVPCSGILVVTESLAIPTFTQEGSTAESFTAEAGSAITAVLESAQPVSQVTERQALALQDGVFDPCSCDPLLDTAYAIYDGQFDYDATLIYSAKIG